MSPLTPRAPRRVVVIGAGAAGSMAAIFAAKGGAKTTLLERTRDGGRKILISGGGRCNVLPMHVDESRFVTDSSPNSCTEMLRVVAAARADRVLRERAPAAARRRSRSRRSCFRSLEQGARRARRTARVRDTRGRDAPHEHRGHGLQRRSTAGGAWRCDGARADRRRCRDRRDGWSLRAEHGQRGTRVCASSRGSATPCTPSTRR